MKNELSILIPCYNCRCGKLVNVLHALLKKEEERHGREAFRYEIIVADDGSTDTASIEENKYINSLNNCRYVIREKTPADLPYETFSPGRQNTSGCCLWTAIWR